MQKKASARRTFVPISDEQLYANPLLYLLLVPYHRIYRSEDSSANQKTISVRIGAQN